MRLQPQRLVIEAELHRDCRGDQYPHRYHDERQHDPAGMHAAQIPDATNHVAADFRLVARHSQGDRKGDEEADEGQGRRGKHPAFALMTRPGGGKPQQPRQQRGQQVEQPRSVVLAARNACLRPSGRHAGDHRASWGNIRHRGNSNVPMARGAGDQWPKAPVGRGESNPSRTEDKLPAITC